MLLMFGAGSAGAALTGAGAQKNCNSPGGCTLNVGPAFLDKGNHQFHKS